MPRARKYDGHDIGSIRLKCQSADRQFRNGVPRRESSLTADWQEVKQAVKRRARP